MPGPHLGLESQPGVQGEARDLRTGEEKGWDGVAGESGASRQWGCFGSASSWEDDSLKFSWGGNASWRPGIRRTRSDAVWQSLRLGLAGDQASLP